MKRGFVRTIPALVVAAGLMLSVAACSSPGSIDGCTPTFQSGTASEQVEASGDFGSEPTIDFPTPLFADETQVTELSQGEGERIEAGQIVDFEVSAFNGETGEFIDSTGYDPSASFRRTVSAGEPGADLLGQFLQCSTVGSRVAVVTTAGEAFGNAGDPDAPGLDDSVVLVFDVERAFLGKANGVDQMPTAGFPSIALAPNGRPGLTVPKQDPPAEFMIEVLKAGDGKTVSEGDVVVSHLTGLVWGEKVPFQSTWENNAPVSIPALADPASGVIEGLAKALIGQKVGSQVVAIVPPELGYPDGAAPEGIAPGSTLIFVIDILGIE